MRLEDVAAVIRPRGSWESVDLGFALTRRYFPRIALSWIVAVWPLWALMLGLSAWLPPGLMLFIIWWLRPLYGRVALFVLSRAMFGAVPSTGQVLRAWPGMLFRRLGRALFLERFSFQRGLLLPLTMLEGLKGRTRRQRARVISTHSGATATMLGILCGSYELLMTLGIFGLLDMFIPEGLSDDYFEMMLVVGFTGHIPAWLLWTFGGSWLFAMTFIEIFYIGGSFGLYLNCRTQTEGWDVEITFRRMARRLGGVAAAVVALAFAAATAGAQDVERAEADDGSVVAEKRARKTEIERVLADPDFKIHKVKRKVPKYERDLGASVSALEVLGRVLFWSVLVVAVALLVRWIVKNLPSLRGAPPATVAPRLAGPRTVMGMDLAPESLPEDIPAAARARWAAGDAHGALSLLYRGALAWLVNAAALPLRDSDTEGDCVRLARKLPDMERARYFSSLTSSWVNVAYAQRTPHDEEMQSLLDEWPFTGKEAA